MTSAMALCTLHHRIGHVTPFYPYATLLITPNGSISLQPVHPLRLTSSTLDRLYYYLALQCDDQPQSSWHLSSVKACHLPHATSQTLVFHINNLKPFAVDYFVSPTPLDASCPNVTPKTYLVESIRALNTTLILKSSHSPPLPQLRSPLPLTPTGQPVQTLPHKSFLQKYWIYIALFLLALVLTSSEDAGPRRHAQA